MSETPARVPVRSAAVLGASFAGLLAAAALARAGYAVTLLERDVLPEVAEPRPGVPQSRQPHVLLHRGLEATEALLPGLQQDLLDAGGVAFDTGEMPQLTGKGWLPQGPWAGSTISISRTRLELLVRRRVLALPGVTLVEGSRISGLGRLDDGWEVIDERGARRRVAWVVDASGRGSRMSHWLRQLGVAVAEPEVVEAKVGYACRTYRGDLPFRTGVLLASTPENPAGGSALPIEDGRWLICAAGYGDHRPGRDTDDFEPFLDRLSDSALADIARTLEPESGVTVHRQTGNRRHAYGSAKDWPHGLLVVGDALCAFNPVYGQGITVAAMQAELLGRAFGRGRAVDRARSRLLQRRLGAVADVAWSVSTGEDRRFGADGPDTALTRVTGHWIDRIASLAAAGDEDCCRAFGRLYHLTAGPTVLVGPHVAGAVVRSLWRRPGKSGPRPAELAALAGHRTAG